jgi:hypothetical protein
MISLFLRSGSFEKIGEGICLVPSFGYAFPFNSKKFRVNLSELTHFFLSPFGTYRVALVIRIFLCRCKDQKSFLVQFPSFS